MKVAYIKTTPETTVSISRIVTIHYYEFDKTFVFDGEAHDFWEMVYVDRGQVLVRRDEEEIVLSQGEVIFHRPNEFHSIRALHSAPQFFVISFACTSPAMVYFERYKTVLDKALIPFITSIISEAENTYVIPKNDPFLKRLTRKIEPAIGGEQLIKTYMEQLLIFMIRSITRAGAPTVFPSKESMEDHLVREAKRLIREHMGVGFRVGELCHTLGYSKSYLSRLFREQTGETLAAYAVKKRIDEAKRLIREGQLNFAEISDILGFDNPQYFSRTFKRLVGMTPTEFRATMDIRRGRE